jgi:hypothetical protein
VAELTSEIPPRPSDWASTAAQRRRASSERVSRIRSYLDSIHRKSRSSRVTVSGNDIRVQDKVTFERLFTRSSLAPSGMPEALLRLTPVRAYVKRRPLASCCPSPSSAAMNADCPLRSSSLLALLIESESRPSSLHGPVGTRDGATFTRLRTHWFPRTFRSETWRSTLGALSLRPSRREPPRPPRRT